MAYPLDPRRLLVFAAELQNSADEVKLRTAVGRAYYGIFLLERERAGIVNETGQAHRLVGESFELKSWRAGTWYHDLHRLRKLADYDLCPSSPADQDWVENMDQAAWLVSKLLPLILHSQPPA